MGGLLHILMRMERPKQPQKSSDTKGFSQQGGIPQSFFADFQRDEDFNKIDKAPKELNDPKKPPSLVNVQFWGFC